MLHWKLPESPLGIVIKFKMHLFHSPCYQVVVLPLLASHTSVTRDTHSPHLIARNMWRWTSTVSTDQTGHKARAKTQENLWHDNARPCAHKITLSLISSSIHLSQNLLHWDFFFSGSLRAALHMGFPDLMATIYHDISASLSLLWQSAHCISDYIHVLRASVIDLHRHFASVTDSQWVSNLQQIPVLNS